MQLDRLFLLMSFIVLLASKIIAQPDSLRTDAVKNISVTAYPVIFYLPETRWGGGAASVVTFRLPREGPETRPSSFNGVAVGFIC